MHHTTSSDKPSTIDATHVSSSPSSKRSEAVVMLIAEEDDGGGASSDNDVNVLDPSFKVALFIPPL